MTMLALLLRRLRGFAQDVRAAVTIEYVVLLLPLLMLVFVSFQIALAYHFSLTAQKAVELGARIAAVRDPVSLLLPRVNTFDGGSGASLGDPCAETGACVDPGGPWVCTGADLGGGACSAAAFQDVFAEVDRIAYLLDPEDLSVSYYYGRLGYAGGPFVPIVQVSIQERPFFLQFFFNLGFGLGGDPDGRLDLPAVAASAIAEDLSTSN